MRVSSSPHKPRFEQACHPTPGFGLVSRNEITRVEQLRGKRIGIGQFGADPITPRESFSKNTD
jgi:hypothetical protein